MFFFYFIISFWFLELSFIEFFVCFQHQWIGQFIVQGSWIDYAENGVQWDWTKLNMRTNLTFYYISTVHRVNRRDEWETRTNRARARRSHTQCRKIRIQNITTKNKSAIRFIWFFFWFFSFHFFFWAKTTITVH